MNRLLPMILAVALFMENMDSTVIATSLAAPPNLKAGTILAKEMLDVSGGKQQPLLAALASLPEQRDAAQAASARLARS